MTVKQDLEKAVASSEAAQGTYMMFAESTTDQSAKSMYNAMADDVTRHMTQLRDRLDYLGQANPLNQNASQNHQNYHRKRRSRHK